MWKKRSRSAVVRNSGIIIISLVIAISFLALIPLGHRTSSAESIAGWSEGTSYPSDTDVQSCAAYSGYVYCVGGDTGSGYTNAVYYAPISSSGVGTWSSTTSFPVNLGYISCVTNSGYIYCVGGLNGSGYSSAVYYATISSSGVGTWSSTTSYPSEIGGQSCAAYSDYIYCVGGLNGSGYSSAVYYATISSSGVGTWSSTASYPNSEFTLSCTTYSGYIYCVGGENAYGYSSAVYYATISSSGVGTWSSTTSYPSEIADQPCAAYFGYIYCVGGETNDGLTVGVYYAPISPSGVGTWTTTAGYPTFGIEEESCAISAGYIYCIGGNTDYGLIDYVYYAEVNLAGSLSPWGATTSYPTNVFGPSCAVYSGYIYCVGGLTGSGYSSAVYYAPISSSGVGAWSSTTSYPTDIEAQSCAAYSGYIYCVAGYTGSAVTDTVYYATISSSGVGSWTSTASYPADVFGQSCATYSGYIYCVGGEFSNGDVTYGVAYASVSSSGVGTWSYSSNYPKDIAYESCVTGSGYIYCIAGEGDSHVLIDNVYYAAISSSGVGAWSSTTSYPTDIYDQSCTAYAGYIYCVGGYNTSSSFTNAVYYTPISSSGVGNWGSTTSYPIDIEVQSCATYSGYIYCVAGDSTSGYTNAVYYAAISSSGTTTTSSTTLTSTVTTTSSTTITSTLTSTVTSTSTLTSTTTSTVTTTSPTTTTQTQTTTVTSTSTTTSPTTTTVTTTQTSPTTTTVTTTVTSISTTTLTSTTTSPTTTTVTSTTTSVSTTTTTSPTTTTITSTTTTTSTQLVPTSTKVTCKPSTVKEGSPTTCTAIAKSADGSKLPGKVEFSSSGEGTFSAVTCKEDSTGTKCTVTYTPSQVGKQIINGTYPGDQYHAPSSGFFTLTVTGDDPAKGSPSMVAAGMLNPTVGGALSSIASKLAIAPEAVNIALFLALPALGTAGAVVLMIRRKRTLQSICPKTNSFTE